MAFLMGTQVWGPLLREESFIRKRDFYKQKQILLEEGTSIKGRKSYFEKRRLLWGEDSVILKRGFF